MKQLQDTLAAMLLEAQRDIHKVTPFLEANCTPLSEEYIIHLSHQQMLLGSSSERPLGFAAVPAFRLDTRFSVVDWNGQRTKTVSLKRREYSVTVLNGEVYVISPAVDGAHLYHGVSRPRVTMLLTPEINGLYPEDIILRSASTPPWERNHQSTLVASRIIPHFVTILEDGIGEGESPAPSEEEDAS